MAAGLPVIATNIPANREAMGKMNESWLVPADDADVLAIKIMEFLNNKNLREQYGIMNKKRILENFSLEKTNEKTLDYIFSFYCPEK